VVTSKNSTIAATLICILALLFISSCGNSAATTPQEADPSSTPTPTEQALIQEPPTPTTVPSICEGLAGELEIHVLVGPAEAVGLEPESVGSIQFSVITSEEPYLVEGSGGLEYTAVLAREWGSFEVTMEMSGTITGTCVGEENAGELDLSLEMAGSQEIIVTYEGVSQTYPWEGTQTFNHTFPIEEGSTLEGEGYSIVLHLE